MDSQKKNTIVKSILFLIIFCFVFFLPELTSIDSIVSRNNDLLASYSIFSFFKHHIIYNKIVPLWQNYILSGSPFVSDPQTILFYLPNYLSLIMPLNWFFISSFMFHFILGSIGMYLLLKRLKLENNASIFGSIIYAYSPKFLAHFEAGHLALLVSYMWFPYVALGLLVLKDRASIKGSILLAVSLYGVFLNYITVFPFVLFICFIFYCYLFFYRLISRKLIIYTIASCFLFLGLSLPSLVSSLPYFSLTTRNLITFEDIGPRVLSYKHFLSSIIFPYVFGFNDLQTESVLYLGVIILILASLGFITVKKEKKIAVLMIGILSLILTLGFKTQMYSLIINIFPSISLFRITTRMWFIPIFMVSILASYFVNRFIRKQWVYILLLIFTASDLYIFKSTYFLNTKTQIEHLGKEALIAATTQDDGYYRILCTIGCIPDPIKEYKGLTSGYNPIQLLNYYHFLQKASGYQFASYSPALPPYQTFVDKPQPSSMYAGILGVRYFVSPYELTDEAITFIGHIDGMYVYKNNNELPRVYGVSDSTIIPIIPTIDKPGYVQIPINKEYDAVVLSEIYMPFWQATDAYGNKIEVIPNSDIVLEINSPKSPYLTLIFKPPYFDLSVSILSITWFFIILKSLKIIKENFFL